MKNEILKKIYQNIFRIRSVEEQIALRYKEQQMRCPVHLSIGQEIVSGVFAEIISKKDFSVSTHRSHAHYLAKGGNLKRMIAELYGKETGCSKGIGGSMHLVDKDVNFMGSSPIVGNIIPIGVGLGLSNKIKNSNQISSIFFGDGAVEEGVFYESLNFSIVRELPILFLCENNLYSVYSDLSERQPKERKIFKMAQSMGVHSKFCNGFNIKEIYNKLKNAVDYIKKNKKPFFLEFSSYRWREHCGPNFDNDIGYRSEKEFQIWKKKDPLLRLRKNLLKNKKIKKNIIKFERKTKKEIDIAFNYAQKSRFINPSKLKNLIYAK